VRNLIFSLLLILFSVNSYSAWISRATYQGDQSTGNDLCLANATQYASNYGLPPFPYRTSLVSGSGDLSVWNCDVFKNTVDDECPSSVEVWDQSVQGCGPDADGDGEPDPEEPPSCVQCGPDVDTDGDGTPDVDDNDDDNDGIEDGADSDSNGNGVPDGEEFEAGHPDVICQDGRKVADQAQCSVSVGDCTGMGDSDCVEPKTRCYNGALVYFSYQCPESTSEDHSDPSAEPNGVCESGSYSYASLDSDCRSPKPNQCPSDNCAPANDSVSDDPDADHDEDGIPNKFDPDADLDGDNIPNGKDSSPGTSYSKDSDGDGQTDDEDDDTEDNNVSGGDSCSTPPQCDGDAVSCSILLQTFKDRCETDKEVGGFGIGDCDKEFSCSGDPIQCASLQLEQQKYCATADAADSVGDEFDAGIAELADGLGEASLTENGVLSELHGDDVDLSDNFSDVFSTAKPLSSSCPPPRTLDLSFVSGLQVSYDPMCDLAVQLSSLVRLLTSLLIMYMFISAFAGKIKST